MGKGDISLGRRGRQNPCWPALPSFSWLELLSLQLLHGHIQREEVRRGSKKLGWSFGRSERPVTSIQSKWTECRHVPPQVSETCVSTVACLSSGCDTE